MRSLILFLCLCTFISLQAKSPDINQYLQQVANGNIMQVKSELPDLMVEYPDDAGVKLLLAVVIDNADKSLDIYKKIVANYPESDWADDAYWRIVQFYAVKGETNKAQYELNYFRTKYPQSPYIVPAAEVVRMATSIFKDEKNDLKAINNNAIGRDNTKVETSNPKYVAPEMIDLTKQKEQTKIQNNVEPAKLEPEKVEPVKQQQEETEPKVQIKKVIATNDTELAINTSNHKVIRQKVNEETQDLSSIPSDILEQQKKLIEESASPNQELEVVESTQKIATADPVAHTGYFGLQVGLYDDVANANAEMKKFLRKRMRTEVKEKSVNNDQKYAVVIGNYSSLESANAAKIIVQQQCDCEPIVFEK